MGAYSAVPYTSLDEKRMKRSTGASRIASSRICVPSTFVVTNSRAPSEIDFSTCDSAAALTITSTSDTTSRTSSASRMSPCTNESRSCDIAPLRLSRLPAYVSASSETTSKGVFASRWWMKLDGMNPAPPVTRTRLGTACGAAIRTHGLCSFGRLIRLVDPLDFSIERLNHARQPTCLEPASFRGSCWQTVGRPHGMARDFQRTPVRVVIVDDHRLFVDALAVLLGHDERLDVIGTAGDGPTAIELAAAGQAEVAVIDVRMPEVDGLETARRLRTRSPATSVILVTGLDEPELAEQARDAGAVALLKKGALHDQLKEAIIEAASDRSKASLSPGGSIR